MLSWALWALFFFSCNDSGQKQLGTIDFKVTGDQEAQPVFEEGLLLLHSFEYEDARELFLQAQEIDPDMAMAYWGEAMSYNHSLWSRQNFEKGTEALNKLADTPEERVEKAKTEIEKDFIRSVNILFQSGKPKKERDQEYADFMEELFEEYRGNHEVAAFYALSLLGSAPEGRDMRTFEKGAKIAEGILAENANHPGALHYLIHSYDDPGHASLALKAADSYAEVAPDASHALHMPSHIYVAMGMWDEVVSSNEASYQASLNRMDRKDLNNDARGYHSYHWLLYGYLQQGRIEDARDLIEDMEVYVEEMPSERARTHLIYLKSTFLAETDLWDDPVARIPVDMEGLNIADQALEFFVQGMYEYAKKNISGMDTIMDQFFQRIQIEELSKEEASITVCGSASGRTATQTDLNQAMTMLWELRAVQAQLKDDAENAERYILKAIELESNTTYSYGPPDIVKPSHELYAEWLLENLRYDAALDYFSRQLERSPNRTRTLQGKLKAAEAIGDEPLAKELKQAIDKNLGLIIEQHLNAVQ